MSRRRALREWEEQDLAPLLRIVSFVLFVSLMLVIGTMLLLQWSHSNAPLWLAIVLVAIFFSIPVGTLTVLSYFRRRFDAIAARDLRKLSAGGIDVDDRVAVSNDDLARAVREIAIALRDTRELAGRRRAVLADIVNGLSEGLLCIGRDRRITLSNQKLSELLDVPTNISGLPLTDVVRNGALLGAFEAALAGRASTARVDVVTRGLRRDLEMRVVPLTAEPDLAAVALLIDLTEVNRLQRIRREFLADFSHEVRTPLAGLKLAVESLSAGVRDEAQAQQLQKIIARQVARLERLVAEVAELNEIESGETVLSLEPTPLLALAHDVADDFRERAAAMGVGIEVGGEEIGALVDAQKIQQVVANLLDNALKHAAGTREIAVDVRGEGENAVLRVTDQGRGIPLEEQERIFHRFYRGDKSRSDSEGTGLGLAIAKHLTLRQGGKIHVESGPQRGSTFVVTLPRSSPR